MSIILENEAYQVVSHMGFVNVMETLQEQKCENFFSFATLTWHFGCVGLGGLNAYVLNIRGNIEETDQGSCLINHAAEPCTHFPMKPTCKDSNASELHSDWMRHHVRECLDHDGGLQLVVEAPQPNNSTRLWEHNH